MRRVHDESIAFLTGNIYCICLDPDCQGHIVFARTDSTLNLVSIPYEIIHRVAFKEKCVRLVLDSTNVKGPCIELEFFDGADFQNAKNQITHYVALCREQTTGSQKSKRNIIVRANKTPSTSKPLPRGTAQAPIIVDPPRGSAGNDTLPLAFDKLKAFALLQNNPEIKKLYELLVPPLEPNEFWNNQSREIKIAVGLQAGLRAGEILSVGKSSDDSIKTDKRGNKSIDLTRDAQGRILRTRPVVEKAYKKFVQKEKVIEHAEFFRLLASNDSYRQGEIDESQINNYGTVQQIFIDIEEEEKLLHLRNRESRLKSANPLFDLRSTYSEVLRGPSSSKEGYGIIDRSLKRVENIDIENTSAGGEETVDERTRKKSKYNMEQFNKQGDRILNSRRAGRIEWQGSNASSKRRAKGKDDTIHPDILSSSMISQYRDVVPLTIDESSTEKKMEADDSFKKRPLKRIKSEETESAELTRLLQAYEYKPKEVYQVISVPAKCTIEYPKRKKDMGIKLMSQTPPQWSGESKGERPTADEGDMNNWVYLRLAKNTNGGINYFDERNINPIKTWSRFKEFKHRNDIFWSQIDLKDLFSKAKVGKELLVFFWSHFANKHSVVKLKQIVQKIQQNIVDIRNLSRSMNSFRPSLEKIIEPLEYAILRYKTKYEKKKQPKMKSEVVPPNNSLKRRRGE